jgi:subfamily B ATP-binding cassette protein HlyB/CyaB
MTLSILCVGALLVMQHDGFTIGMLVAFQMFASRLSQPMLRLAGLWQEFQQASIAVKRGRSWNGYRATGCCTPLIFP